MATEVMGEDAPLRPTGHMEKFNISRNYIARWKFQRQWNSRPRLRSLEGDLNHHPILGVTIHDEGSKQPRWVRLNTIDLRRIVRVISSDPNASPDKWVQDGHREPLLVLEDLPLWRIIVAFQDSKLIKDDSHVSFALGFFAHHGIADGLSCNAFHLTFLDALNALIPNLPSSPSNSDDFVVVSVPKLPLLPTLEMKATLSVSFLFVLMALFKTYVYNPIDQYNWSGPNISADLTRPPISNNRSFALPPSLVSKVVAKCRAEKTTVTALVTILVARKLAVMYPNYKRFTATIPSSLRKFTAHGPRDMGCFISNVAPNLSSEVKPPRGYISCAPMNEKVPLYDDEQLWKTSRKCKQFINANTSTTHNQTVNLLKFVSDLPKFFMGMLGTKRSHAFEVTNIGVVDGGIGGDAERASFDRVMFSAAGCTFSPPYCVFLATVRDGFMNVALKWENGVVGDEEAMDLLGWLESQLRDLAEV